MKPLNSQKVAALAACVSLASAAWLHGCKGDTLGAPDPDAGTDAPSDAPAERAANEGGPDANVLPQGQIDRVGRPGIAVILVSQPRRDGFNALDTFSDTWPPLYDVDLQTNLVRVDRLDGREDWNGGGIPFDGGSVPDVLTPPDGGFLVHPLGALVRSDALLVDTGKPFSAQSFWDIENEALGGPQHLTCGGRSLEEDAMDKMLSIVIKKATTGISDGVNAPAKAPLNTFPYLAPPN